MILGVAIAAESSIYDACWVIVLKRWHEERTVYKIEITLYSRFVGVVCDWVSA